VLPPQGDVSQVDLRALAVSGPHGCCAATTGVSSAIECRPVIDARVTVRRVSASTERCRLDDARLDAFRQSPKRWLSFPQQRRSEGLQCGWVVHASCRPRLLTRPCGPRERWPPWAPASRRGPVVADRVMVVGRHTSREVVCRVLDPAGPGRGPPGAWSPYRCRVGPSSLAGSRPAPCV